MALLIDKQTLADLQVFGHGQQKTLFGLFNHTHTRGGAQVLEQWFRYPLSDPNAINRRSSTIRYFLQNGIEFPFESEWLDVIDHYLDNTDPRTQLMPEEDSMRQTLRKYGIADADYKQTANGIHATIAMLHTLQIFVQQLRLDNALIYASELRQMQTGLAVFDAVGISKDHVKKRLKHERNVYYDRLFRFQYREELQRLLAFIYDLDVYITAGRIGDDYQWSFAKALNTEHKVLHIQAMFHPAVDGAVPNDVFLDEKNHVLFLTGANMAGKSTLMKTLGIAVFLAHMGFPVPAAYMEFSVLQGLFTTINLADNIHMGFSHFFSEVQRIKNIAKHAGNGKRILVIVDELFRGTNVKDAYDATLAVTEAFASKVSCFFVVSSHIIEVAPLLKERCPNIIFQCLPTHVKDGTPRYTYRLQRGITNERHGMVIVQNEGILSILASGKYDE